MPNYKVNNETYTIPDNEVDLFEADFPEAQLHYQTKDGEKYTIYANERKDFLADFPDAQELGWLNESSESKPVEQPSTFPMFDDEPQGEPIPERGFKAGFREGWKGLSAGIQNLWGEAANVVSGSSKDDANALYELDEMLRQGKDVQSEVEDAWSDAGRELRTGALEFLPGWMIKGWKDRVHEKADQQKVLADIRSALQETNGDVAQARALLEQRAQEQSYGDIQMEKAADKFANIQQTEGVGAWIGSNVVQMIPSASALIVGALTKSPTAAKAIGGIGMGAMTAATSGSSMYEARQAGADDYKTWKVGVVDGAIEYITEKLPFDRYTGRIFGKAKGEVAKEFAEAISSKNSPARSELEKLLVEANKRLGGRLFTKKNLKDYMADILAEGASEFSAEALQTMTSMMYEDRENYPTLNEIVGNGLQGALAGIFMGSVLGGASKTMEHVQNRQRRKDQGYVDVALVNFENGDSDVVEIVDADGENAVVLKDGEPVAVNLNNIGRAYRYTFEEFEAARMRQLEDEALDEGNVSDGMLEASATRVNNARTRLDKALANSGLTDEMKQRILSSIETGERIPVVEDIADAYSEYFDEVNRDRDLKASREAADQREREAIVQEIEQNTGTPFWREEVNNGGLEPTKVVETGTLEDGTQVYILSEANENGQSAAVTADGKKMFVSADMMPAITQTVTLEDYASNIAKTRKAEAESNRLSEEKVLRENEVKAIAHPGAQVNLGTQESPVFGTITQTTPDGVIVQTDAGVSQITWEEAANAFNVGMPSMTDAEIARAEAADILDTEAQWRGKQAQTEQEALSSEVEHDVAIEQTKKAMPLPLKSDGSVDQTTLWNQNPERWAGWNDEQRQDGGANSLAYINGAIAKESARIAEMQAGYDTISDFDERDAIEREVAAIRERLQRLVNLRDGYVAQAEAAHIAAEEVAAEQVAPRITSQMSEEEKVRMDAQYENILRQTRTKTERVRLLQEYVNNISEGSMPAVVITKDNFKEAMRAAGCSEALIARVEFFVKAGQNIGAFIANGHIFLMEDGLPSMEEARISYVHERQHAFNSSRPEFVQKVVDAVNGNRSILLGWLSTFMDAKSLETYKDDNAFRLADEVIARCMEIAYTTEEFSVDLQSRGIPSEVISTITEIDNEQRFTQSYLNARRGARRTSYDNVSGLGNMSEDGRNLEQVSGGILEQQETRSSSAGNGRARTGQAGEGAEVISDDEEAEVPTAEEVLTEAGFEADEQNEDARFSVRYLPTPEQREGIIDSIIQITGRTREEAERWLESELSLVPIVLNDKEYLDYAPDSKYKAIKDNSDYPQGTVDFNNICRKRKDFTRMYTRLQRAYPNRIFTAEDLADIRTIMSEDGLVVACGLCYVEDRRQKLGEVADEFIKDLQDGFKSYGKKNATKRANAEKFSSFVGADTYVPSIYDLITLEGSDKLHDEHKGIWDAFGAYNRARGQQTQNTFQGYAEYKREILTWSDVKVKKVNSLGGLRIFSYSDFEAHHLLDIIQIIIDCAARGVMIQGYTKVPEFARVVEKTGIKLNRSLIPLGDTGIVDGKLAYDPIEGIDINDPNFLESNDNVGNILIGINDEQIRMAMADPFIHYIIPYHARQAGNIRAKLNVGAWTNYIDTQNERKMSDGKRVEKNINIYTDVLNESITNDREFVEKYLEVCREKGFIPKFDQFLDKDAEGNYVYTPGYYKFLVDFKLFDEAGNILPQKPVVAQFDDAFNAQVLLDYAREERETAGEAMNSTYDKIVETLDLGEPTVGEDVRFRESEGPIDLVEEARKAQTKHDAKAKKGKRSDVSFRITPEQDKAYMDAVEAGDMETAQRMVIEAARLAMPNTKVVDENGNPKVVYHGSTAMFTIFDKSRIGSATGTADGRGFYFTTDRDYALGYKTPDGQLFEVFLNIEKPLSYDKKTITKAQLRKILKEADRVEYEQEGEHYMLSNYANYNDVGIDGAVNEGANLEYDYADNDVELVGSLIGGSGSFDLIMDAVKKVTGKSGMIAPKDNGTIHYVVTDPAGIKSAEPVTYDDKGNVIPLSERFNPENEDIRFRVTEEQRDEVQFRVISDALYEEMDDMIESLVGASFFRRVEGEFDLGKKVKNFAEFADLITIIKNNDNYISTGSSLLGFFSSHTDQHFPLLLSVDDKALRKQAEADLKEALSQIDDTYILFYIKEAWKAHKNGLAQAGLGVKPNATTKFNKAIDARIEEIRAGRVKGTSFNFKKQEVSLDEIDTLFKQLNTNEELAVLHDKVMDLAKRFGIKPQFAAIRGAAEGESLGDKVRYDYRAFNSPAISDERKANIITHELIHSVTSYAFYLDDYMPNALTPEMREAINILREVYYAIRRDSSFKDEYGASSVEEMVAELSNTAFREKLKEKSLYQRILDAILKLFGVVKEDSAYNAANEALTYIIENYDENAFNLYARQAARSQEYSKWYNSEDVRFRTSNDNQAIFVSNAAKAVEGIKQEKATPEQWLKMLEKAGGLKAGEDKWMGLSDWLKASDKKTLTKQEVLDFINENMIVIEEQHYEEDALDKEALWYKYEESEEGMDAINYQMQLDAEAYAERELADSDLEGEEWEQEYERLVSDYIEDDLFGSARSAAKDAVRDLWMEEEAPKLMKGASREINSTRINYTTTGLDDLHEIALTVPTIESWNESDDIHFGDAGDGRAVAWIRFGETEVPTGEYKVLLDEMNRLKEVARELYEEFGGRSNELAEVEERQNELRAEMRSYKNPGLKVLVIDEIQSKRHQEGRERGYKPDWRGRRKLRENAERAEKEVERIEAEMTKKYGSVDNIVRSEDFDALEAARNARREARLEFSNPRYGAVPDAPFDKNWHELAMKRMLRYAAENGYDLIAWTKGAQQNQRYGLSKVVDEIYVASDFASTKSEESSFRMILKNGNDNHVGVNKKTGVVTFYNENPQAIGKPLSDLLGKEMADKILAAKDYQTFRGVDFELSEGMKGFYDKMLPAFMNKYGKKWGVKVEDIELPKLEEAGRIMHSIPVTEEMKASVMEGQVMFRVRGENESAEEFVDNIIEDFKSRYNAFNDIFALDPTSKEQLAEFVGIPADALSDEMAANILKRIKDRDSRGWFNPDTKRIAIFVREDVTDSKKSELVLIHENMHAINRKHPELIAIGEYLWNNAKEGTREYKYKTEITKAYPESEWFDEMSSYVVSEYMQDEEIDKLKNLLDAEHNELLNKLLNKSGYGKDRKQRPRVSWNVLRERPSDRSEELRSEGGAAQSGRTAGNRAESEGVQMRNGNVDDRQRPKVTWTRDESDSDLRFRATEITPEVRDEMDTIAAIAIVNGNYMKAPNGKDSNLTAEQWAMVRTKNFKSWFGDWENDPENASKVVDENGEPMVVYHGTAGVINSFEDQQRSPGFWFVDREDVANGYAESASVEFGEDKNVIPVFLNIRNPRTEDAYGEFPAEFALKSYVENDNGVYQEFDTYEEAEAYRKENVPDGWVGASKVGDQHDLVERAVELGHDGVIMKGMHDQAVYAETRVNGTQTNYVVFNASQIKSATDNTGEFSEGEGDIRFSIRTKPAPEKTGIGYKVFYLKDGKLYPPMVANLGGVDTPVLVWLDADAAPQAATSKTGRKKVKAGGKGTQGGSGTLAYRPGWHLGEIPYALQFNRGPKVDNPLGITGKNGKVIKVGKYFPNNFVWAEVEYANEVDYQDEATSYGYNEAGNFQHSLAGLPKVPEDGSYIYRTNANPATDPWIITGAMKVTRLLTPSEVDQMVIDAGREPQERQEGAVTDEQIKALNKELGLVEEEVSFRVTGTPTEDVVAEGVSLSPAQLASLAGDIFAALPEESRKKITDGLNGNILGLQDAILQIPTSLATKENWNDEDRQMAEVIAEQMTKAVGIEMTRPFSASEALWTLYNAVNKSTDLVSEASRALVRRNLGFDSQTLEMEKDARDGVRFRTVGNASANAQASMYNRGVANVWTRLKESFVDMHASVEKLVKAIEKRSGKVAEGFENILMALNQQSKKGLAAMEAYEQKFLNKMFDEIREIMNKTDFKYEDIVRYVILKHGLERNEKMAQRDAKAHYQEIYDDIIAKIKGMNPAQKRTYLTNAQLRDADAKAELARLQGVNTSALTPDQLRDHKKELAKAKKEATEAAEHLVRAQKIATMTEQDALDELDKIFKKIEKGTDSIYKEMRKNDYSGISSMFYDTLGVDRKNYATEEEYQSALMQAKADKYDTLGDIEGAAQTEVTLFENAVNTDNLWKSINKATKETLRQQYDANMISKDQYLNLRDMFEYYVPLRGFADNTAEDMYTYYRRPNSTGYTKPILGAEGRKTEAESPFGWIAAMAGSAIASNVKNEAKLALYYFVANRPDNGIATLSKTWFVHTPGDVDANGKKIFRPAYPPFNEDLSSASAKADYEVWQANMKNLQAQGLAYEAGQRLNLGNSVVNISDTNKPEHIVNVKVGGKDYTIVINGNPRAAQAINGDLNIESSAQDYGTVFGPMLRWMSSVNTSYNPEFWITNMMRDVAFTLMAVNIKGDPAYRKKFGKNYLKALKVVSMVAKNEKGTLGNSYIENMYKDFVKYGGVTGYTQIKDSETWEKEIENYLTSNDPASIRNGKVMRDVKSVFHAFHRFGESLEQVSRFAAFLTAVETGKSINEAINDAKEITVNFNRKGSGKMITLEEAKYLTDKNGQPLNKLEQWAVVGISSIAPLGRRMIMFFNAAIQGLNATYKLYAKNKTRAIGWALGYAAVGVINAVLHAMLDDDDDYLDIPQYERRNSLMIGGNGAYFKWALPQEARAFYALGDLAVESVMGRNPHQNVIGEALKISTEILPINPSEGWKAFMPSVAIPFVELALNEDYKGAPIYNEQKWLTEEERKRSTKWSKAYSGTGDLYIGIAKVLNAVTGGDEHDAGLINLQPEKMEHIVQSAFGGTIRTADKFINTIMAAIDPEEDVTVRQFPFLNRFLTINDERFKNVHVNDVYDYYAAEAEHAISLQKQYTKDRNSDALKDLRSSEEYKWARIYSKYKKPIKKYQEAIRAADTTNERMELMKQQDELKRKMIKEISEL